MIDARAKIAIGGTLNTVCGRDGSTRHPIRRNPPIVSLEFRRRKRFDRLPMCALLCVGAVYHLTFIKGEMAGFPDQPLELPEIFGMPVSDCI